MKIVGIDLGSRSVKLVINQDWYMKDSLIIDTAEFYRKYCKNQDGKLIVDFQALGIKEFDKLVTTGYGRNNVNVLNAKKIVELKAHVYGAIWQTGLKNFLLLDVGGQDSKIVLVKDERIKDILLNDKCAASCGRYLENMAHVLGIDLLEMVEYVEEPVELSSTCAVFAESELIGKISEGASIEELAAGVNYSLFKRIKPLLSKFESDRLIVTGGVAINQAFIKYIESELDYKEVIVPQHEQLNGAIGCCAYGLYEN